MHVVFETPRLVLRQFSNDDSSLILKLNRDPQVLKNLHEPVLTTEEQANKIITDIILPQYQNNLGRWAIHTKIDMEFNWLGWLKIPCRVR